MKVKKYNKKVYVAMSGGVDSSVAAWLLKERGYDVTGVFMKYWMDSDDILSGNENRCCSLDARKDAMRVCAHLGIPFLTWDFQKEFKKAVVDEFVDQYKNGLTPNPCVTCNKEIKLGIFINKALKEGASACRQAGIFVATGHYAKNLRSQKNYKLCPAKDNKKDQSYFLYNLKQGQLAHILFPLGNLIKDEVRELAAKAGLPVAAKKDSQEVCFVNKGGLKDFLGKRVKLKEGDIVLSDGKVIGRHSGAMFYTIGQKAPVGGTGPYYVINKNLKKNQLVVAKDDDKDLFVSEVFVKNVNWISGKIPKFPMECQVKTRYQQKTQKMTISNSGSKAKKPKRLLMIFKKPQRAITPGQSAVFYKGKEIIGGGVIA